jgi:hypothetical protein
LKNDKEVHYHELRQADIYHIACRWLGFFLSDKRLTYLYILGINLSRLNFDFFGSAAGAERYYRIYNRFFRTALQKSVKSYFSSAHKIVIDRIFHDSGDIQGYESFPWHSIYKLGTMDPKLLFQCNNIDFIESDHRISRINESHLIQYLDLLLGLVYNCFHATGKNARAKELTLRVCELVERLVKAPGNIHSSYEYVNRLSIDFFPKHSISTEDNLINTCLRSDSFYKKRVLAIRDLEQPELFQ